MYWAEVTMRDSNTKRFESERLNDIYDIFGKYSQCNRRASKASEMKFGTNDIQTGFWNPSTGLKSV